MATIFDQRRNAERRARLKTARRAAAGPQGDENTLDEEAGRELAAMLIARRIVLGIEDEQLVERLGGYQVIERLRSTEDAERRTILTYHEARRIEHDMLTDGRVSTFQRYARLVDLRVTTEFRPESPPRRRRRVEQFARFIRTRRRFYAKKFSKTRPPRSYY